MPASPFNRFLRDISSVLHSAFSLARRAHYPFVYPRALAGISLEALRAGGTDGTDRADVEGFSLIEAVLRGDSVSYV